MHGEISMKRSVRSLTLCLSFFAAAHAHARELPDWNEYQRAAPSASIASNAAAANANPLARVSELAGRFGGLVASIDEQRGVPNFLWAVRGAHAAPPPGTTPEAAARKYLQELAPVYGLSKMALRMAQVVQVHDLGQGAVVVTLRQRIHGADVHRNEVKVVMRQNLELVAISGNLHADAVPTGKPGSRTFRRGPEEALAAALKDRHEIAVDRKDVVDTQRVVGDYGYFDVAPGSAFRAANLHLVEPARVKKVFSPMPDRVVPAYFVEILSGEVKSVHSTGTAYVISADDGHVLFRQNLTHSDAFDYRVWAEPNGRPLDGPQADFTPHPTGIPDGTTPAFIAPSLVSMEGFNRGPGGTVDPWLPAAAVQTLGNNVDAYADHYDPDGFSNGDLRATTTGTRAFDRTYDTALPPLTSQDQTMAAVTQLFYMNNWLHDWYYDSGFDEAAGNAQQNNFGRGGVGGDVLLAEAQDGALSPTNPRNNASMDVRADGASPRMQMFLWTPTVDIQRTLTVEPGPQVGQTGTAAFGPTTFNVSGELVLADDGTPVTSDACGPIVNDVAGKIVLIDGGSCTFKSKAVRAQEAGAIGVILANNTAGAAPPTMADDDPAAAVVTIPVLSVIFEDGAAMKTALLGGPVHATLVRILDIERDSTIDNTIVAHEWGHYFHLRLTNCGSPQCLAMSEGWGDFTALHMVLREEDNLDGAFPIAVYASNDGYFGVRRAPYATDTTKNGFSFRHIAAGAALPTHPLGLGSGDANDDPHNAGEIWALMLFEAYISLIRQEEGGTRVYTFEQARRLMSDYVVAGLKITPTDPTYTEQRDAILAAAYARNEADMLSLAQGFVRRGGGGCAVAPARYSDDFVGVVESFDLKSPVAISALSVNDELSSCDSDGILDAGERGLVTIEVTNAGLVPLVGSTATISSSNPNITFPNGQSRTLGDIPPLGRAIVTVEVALADGLTDIESLELTARVDNAEACEVTVSKVEGSRINVDEVPSTVDTVESATPSWEKTGELAGAVWERANIDSINHAWHGADLARGSDTSLESPALEVNATDPFVITLQHRYSFDASDGFFWDGGVIEISDDGGASWQDISEFVDPGYGGAIPDIFGPLPLAGRNAFVAESPSWPAQDTLVLDFGTALAGRTVKIRFRISTTASDGDFGWELDNIEIQGIDNRPFGSLVPNAALCQVPPVANAGPDQTVEEGSVVALDASASSDANSDPLTFTWTQTAGPRVTIDGASGVTGTFAAPDVAQETRLTFQVEVNDGIVLATDTVDVVVTPRSEMGNTGGGSGGIGGEGGSGGEAPPPSLGSDDDSCDCAVAGGPATKTTAPIAAFVAMALLGLRRRRGGRASS
jgi:MYXO-CTERM domain-containing protein